ncbi:MAG: DUF1893 domain-containing protein [Bacteroidales bacterium]|nr:DUF1893 domain-containing protein [Bacteroidales bacterium]
MLNTAKTLLKTRNFTLVAISSDKEVFTSSDRGVKPLLHLLENEKDFLKGASVADKVIGKAAALLMVLGGIKEVHTNVISEPAAEIFEKHNITFFFDKKVERIINRKGDGLCPMETLCIDVEEPSEAFEKIKEWLEKHN